MNITAQVRREVCKLRNVIEAARYLEIPIQALYYRIRKGDVMPPEVVIGSRRYYHNDDLAVIAQQFAACKKPVTCDHGFKTKAINMNMSDWDTASHRKDHNV